MPSSPPMVRPATPDDAAFAAPLIQATIGRIGWALTGTQSDESAARVIQAHWAQPGHRLSLERVRVLERAGEPLGLSVAYPGANAWALDEPWRARLQALGQPDDIESEGTPGELYLDTLAVVPAARGQGLGAHLLAHTAHWAAGLGLPRVGLLVEADNPAARLYARAGFRPVGTRQLAGGTYTHLVRPVSAPSE
ncbi:GNAT family N-acetyltransferase [Deinococcus multiflagellatus]|uniref:GNAT family N-acetyltransferase n=1 Tax=Deinococcus multiflagellatus TaxID=1656887 RepID=A0ABW1ZFS2_9DEIO|nr:GNAT family N-acetyltransferase [Deinococcus multiflagellatus]MBZ9712682.1 GNAT family N-acetyltransferase [Deinococcus multiflagellatus]